MSTPAPSPEPASQHAVAVTAPPPTPAITPEQMRELAQADELERPLLGAHKIALVNGVGFAACAALMLPFAFFDAWLWLGALLFGAFAYVELTARRALAAYDPRALRALCLNQVAFCVCMLIYAATQAYFSSRGGNPISEALREHPELSSMLGGAESGDFLQLGDEFTSMYRVAIVGFYALVALFTLIFQGGCAYYYATRRAPLAEFLARTPAWVVDFKRARGRR